MLTFFYFSILCTLLIAAGGIYNLVKLLLITQTPIYKINQLSNNKKVALQVTLSPSAQNNLISPLTKTPCCWYRLTLEYSSQVPLLQGSFWGPLEKFSEDRIIEVHDETGQALLATHLAKIYINNKKIFYLNTRPNLRDPNEIQAALLASNDNIFLKGANWLSTRNLHADSDSLEEPAKTSSSSFLRSYIVPFVYRLTEEVLVDNQQLYILGENHLVNGLLTKGPLGDTLTSLAFNGYLETHKGSQIKNFISAGDSRNLLVCSDIDMATADYKFRGILFCIIALGLLILTLYA